MPWKEVTSLMKLDRKIEKEGKKSLSKIQVGRWNQAGFWRLALHRLFNWHRILRVRLEEEEKKTVFKVIYMKMRRRGKSRVLKCVS